MTDLELLATADPHVYKRTPQGELSLYVLRPAARFRRRPTMAVVYFTGGAWRHGGPENMIANAAWLRDCGAVGISADYRVFDRHGTSPIECVRDAKSALRFVRAHAGTLGVDPARIVAAGGSAGGHIAACTAIAGLDEPAEDPAVSSRGDALLLHNPVTGGPGFEPAFFKAHPEANPMRHVGSGWPATMISCGTADDVTPYADAAAFADRIRAAGSRAELVTISDASHSCDWPASNPHFAVVMERMTRFLRDVGMLAGDRDAGTRSGDPAGEWEE